MKQVIATVDGTWNEPRQKNTSSVAEIGWLLANDPGQAHKYFCGVGSQGWALLGGLFGVGLNDLVKRVYAWLCKTADMETLIFLFGFSRGAYVVRIVADMVSKVGLVPKPELVDEAWDAYMTNDPSVCEDFHRFYGTIKPPIHFLGVFDTVGKHGVPGGIGNYLIPRFSDNLLSDNVRHARQALALHERRVAFTPCLWENEAHADMKQVWFRGWHSDIGGSSSPGLGDVAKEWMLSEAEACDLRLVQGWRNQVLPNSRAAPCPPTMSRFVRKANRKIPPEAKGVIHPSVTLI